MLPTRSPQGGGRATGNRASAADSRTDGAFLRDFWGWSDHSRRCWGALICLSHSASPEGKGKPTGPSVHSGWREPVSGPGDLTSLSPAAHQLLLFLLENLRHSDHPWVVLSPAIMSKQIRLKCFRRRTGSVPGSVSMFRRKTRAWESGARRPDPRVALSRSASPLQGKDAGARPHTASGAEDGVLWCWGHKQTSGSMTRGLQTPRHTEKRPRGPHRTPRSGWVAGDPQHHRHVPPRAETRAQPAAGAPQSGSRRAC